MGTIHLDGTPVDLGQMRFRSARRSHQKVFKHVYGLSGRRPGQPPHADPEQWERVLVELEGNFVARQQRALAAVRAVPSCGLGQVAPTDKEPCIDCADSSAIRGVSARFEEIVQAMEKTAIEAFEWALNNPSAHGPRMHAFRHQCIDGGCEIRLATVDNRKVFTVAAIRSGGGSPCLVTIYRSGEASYAQEWMKLSREAAGHRILGTAVSIERP